MAYLPCPPTCATWMAPFMFSIYGINVMLTKKISFLLASRAGKVDIQSTSSLEGKKSYLPVLNERWYCFKPQISDLEIGSLWNWFYLRAIEAIDDDILPYLTFIFLPSSLLALYNLGPCCCEIDSNGAFIYIYTYI